MNSPQRPKLSFAFILRTFLTASLAVITLINCFQLYKETMSIRKIKRVMPFSFPGLRFSGLEAVFEGVERIGFYTDKDVTAGEYAAIFAQAQLVLAPTILDLNNLQHTFILFDCTREEMAMAKIKEIGAIPLKRNQYGIILARRTK